MTNSYAIIRAIAKVEGMTPAERWAGAMIAVHLDTKRNQIRVRQILIAEESGFSKEMIKGAEMKAKNSFLYSLASAMGTSESGPESLSLNERFFLAQFDTIRRIADEGSCVIVGRCSDYVLRGLPEASHIFIYAEEKDKIKRAVQEYGVPEDEVQKLMRDTDKARANYYAYHTGRKWGEHVNYSLSIDSGYIEIEDIVDLIVQYTKVRRFSQA